MKGKFRYRTSCFFTASIILFFSVLKTESIFAQLVSPGALSSVHASLEGVNNCTKCHNFGDKTFRAQCLACHTQIKSRIDVKRGYHFTSRTVECGACHKEHHGKDFKLIHFDAAKFDHRQAGFILEGSHARLECKKCHDASKITMKDMSSKSASVKAKTFLGLETSCKGCHDDYHRGQFSTDCGNCHSLTQWKPPSKFSHSSARFKLSGKHGDIACDKCHPQKSDGRKIYGVSYYLQFRGVKFGNCVDCHKDKHNGAFGDKCDKCHAPSGWKSVKLSGQKFDHDKTRFHLSGLHATTSCEKCHKNGAWTAYKDKDLERCLSCHEDYHHEQFSRTDRGECSRCHTVEGFLPPKYEVVDHRESRFPLMGAHLSVPCRQCHAKIQIQGVTTAQFHWDKFECIACHRDPHAGQFAAILAKAGCESCHGIAGWQPTSFRHESARFKLDGKHGAVDCDKCHKSESVNGRQTIRYHFEDFRCAACHEDIHRGQFADPVTKITACEKCHTPTGWKPAVFDHTSDSRFPLTGKHLGLECGKCHKKEMDPEGIEIMHFKPLDTACIACHPEAKQ